MTPRSSPAFQAMELDIQWPLSIYTRHNILEKSQVTQPNGAYFSLGHSRPLHCLEKEGHQNVSTVCIKQVPIKQVPGHSATKFRTLQNTTHLGVQVSVCRGTGWQNPGSATISTAATMARTGSLFDRFLQEMTASPPHSLCPMGEQ